MPAISKTEAAKKLAEVAEHASPEDLAQIFAELHPEKSHPQPPTAAEVARVIRSEAEAEEIVDLWNVVFPDDFHVWYNEESDEIHFNEEMISSLE